MNPSIAERESCPDCMVLERENMELKERVKALEAELESTRDERDGWINQSCQHRERLDALEAELAEQARRWGSLSAGIIAIKHVGPLKPMPYSLEDEVSADGVSVSVISPEKLEQLRADWEKLHQGPPRQDPAV